MNKYEQLIEHIINDDEAKARALFHEIVVEKSRDIYESLMDEEYAEEDIGGGRVDRMMGELAMDETDGMAEGEGEEEFDLDHDEDGVMAMGDMDGMHDMGGEGDLEQKVMDLEDELEALKAEFEELMGAEAGEEHDMDDMDMDDMDMDDEGDEADDEDDSDDNMTEAADDDEMTEAADDDEMTESVYESKHRAPLQRTAVDLMREYVEKISAPSNTEFTPVGTGAGGDKPAGNTKNPVAGKNDMGGTAQNIVHGGQGADAHPDGTSPKGKADGKLVKAPKEIDVATRNVNKVGGNKGAQNWYNTKASAKKGEGQTTDGSVPTNHRSIEGGGN